MGCLKLKYQDKSFSPFGMAMVSYVSEEYAEYRYGFNGKENETESFNGAYAFEARIYDARIGRWLSTDRREGDYAWQSTYAYFKNSPISQIDYLGMGGEEDPPKEENCSTNSNPFSTKDDITAGQQILEIPDKQESNVDWNKGSLEIRAVTRPAQTISISYFMFERTNLFAGLGNGSDYYQITKNNPVGAFPFWRDWPSSFSPDEASAFFSIDFDFGPKGSFARQFSIYSDHVKGSFTKDGETYKFGYGNRSIGYGIKRDVNLISYGSFHAMANLFFGAGVQFDGIDPPNSHSETNEGRHIMGLGSSLNYGTSIQTGTMIYKNIGFHFRGSIMGNLHAERLFPVSVTNTNTGITSKKRNIWSISSSTNPVLTTSLIISF